jgi:hypothetical protein
MSLFSKALLVFLMLLVCAACGPAATVPVSYPPEVASPSALSASSTPLPSPTSLTTPTDLPPTPTETLLPTAELPTPASLTHALETWVGAPTYAAESQPGLYFSVEYDGSSWALTEDELGSPALVHRYIPYCQIAPVGGRGLPAGWTVDDQFRAVGEVQYEVVTASQDGTAQFVNYFSGGAVQTGFQVTFQEQKDECLQAAEAVLATLTSVPAPPATLTPTPTETETPSP